MPEEINRILTDHISDLLFVSEESGKKNLRAEGIESRRVYFVGNTMIDSLHEHSGKAERSSALQRLGLQSGRYALLTLHRAANVDNRETFLEILRGLEELAATCRIIFPIHPRTQKQIREQKLEKFFVESGEVGIHLTAPQGYLDFLCLMKHAKLVVTDSGGIQEETTALGVPCVTVRNNTERPVTIEVGTNLLGGTRCETIAAAIQRQLAFRSNGRIPEKWDGMAATRIVQILADKLGVGSSMRTIQSHAAQIAENAR